MLLSEQAAGLCLCLFGLTSSKPEPSCVWRRAPSHYLQRPLCKRVPTTTVPRWTLPRSLVSATGPSFVLWPSSTPSLTAPSALATNLPFFHHHIRPITPCQKSTSPAPIANHGLLWSQQQKRQPACRPPFTSCHSSAVANKSCHPICMEVHLQDREPVVQEHL